MKLIRTEECKDAIKNYFKDLIDKGQQDVDVVSTSAELIDIVNNIEMDAVLMPEADAETEKRVDELQRIYKEKNMPEAYKFMESLCEDEEAFNATYEACIKQATMIVDLLEQYMAIGTVEECLAAVEKNSCKDCDCANERAMAIDKLKNKICMHLADWKYSEDDKRIKDIIKLASESVEEIAEQMKGGGNNE